jgi:hypothetical protein
MDETRAEKYRVRYVVLWVAAGALLTVSSGLLNQDRQPARVAQATSDAPRSPPPAAPINRDNQASPQGPTGPLDTTSGGAPPSSPQGDTPAGMQAAPQGSDKAIRSPPK